MTDKARRTTSPSAADAPYLFTPACLLRFAQGDEADLAGRCEKAVQRPRDAVERRDGVLERRGRIVEAAHAMARLVFGRQREDGVRVLDAEAGPLRQGVDLAGVEGHEGTEAGIGSQR